MFTLQVWTFCIYWMVWESKPDNTNIIKVKVRTFLCDKNKNSINPKNKIIMKKIFLFFLALAASVGTLFAESGTCGANLTWDLTGGVLTISGTGAMTDYTYSDPAPWYANRESITSVTIGNGVTSIGIYAFYSCSGLTSVTIPNSVTSIGERAFSSCWSLTSITIPNSVTSIGKYAFSSLTAVTIPNSVTSIGEYAFASGKLTSIDVASDNPNYCSVDGVLFNKDKTELIQYPLGNARTEYTIPNSVTSIGGGAFEGCSSLTSITIPSSVTSIGNYAFMECSGLTSVTIPSSVISIGYTAFKGCSSLTSVTIPNSVTSIGNYVFQSCSSLTSVEIPNSVTSIGYGAFYNCSGLTSITCYATIPPICGDYAFYNVPKTIPVYVPALSVADYRVADGWKDFGDNIQAFPPQTKSMTPTWGELGWDESHQQWILISYELDASDNPLFYFGVGVDGVKETMPTSFVLSNSTDDQFIFVDAVNPEDFQGVVKDAAITVTVDGSGYQYDAVGARYYLLAKFSGEMNDADGNKLIVNEPADFIKLFVPTDVATAIDNQMVNGKCENAKIIQSSVSHDVFCI